MLGAVVLIGLVAGVWYFVLAPAEPTIATLADEFASPNGIAVIPDGTVLVADAEEHVVRAINPDGSERTFAGTGVRGYAGDGGPATEAQLDVPTAIAVHPDGRVFIADRFNCKIRVVEDGEISTYAGINDCGYDGDGGPADEATLNEPTGVAVDSDGRVVIADHYNNRLRIVHQNGIIETVAGTGDLGFSGNDQQGEEVDLGNPYGVAVHPDGRIVFVDTANHRVRAVGTDGRVENIAGTGRHGYSGDGGSALEAELNLPTAVAIDPEGRIVIADTGNQRIRVIGTDGRISTSAGSGVAGIRGDGGSARAAELGSPRGVAIDEDGQILIADTDNGRVRRVED